VQILKASQGNTYTWEGSGLETRAGDRISWLRVLVVFLSPYNRFSTVLYSLPVKLQSYHSDTPQSVASRPLTGEPVKDSVNVRVSASLRTSVQMDFIIGPSHLHVNRYQLLINKFSIVSDRTGIMGLNPRRSINVILCVVLCRQRQSDGPIPHPGTPTKVHRSERRI
jgi:hypothetical protein